jgi:HEAT repeat protein
LASVGSEADASKAIPALWAALRDTDRIVRTNAAAALGKILPDNEWAIAPSLPALSELLKDKHAHVRLAAAGALLRIGHGDVALPTFLAALKANEIAVRRYAARHLSAKSLRDQAKSAAAALSKAIADPDSLVRINAATSLIVLGEADTGFSVIRSAARDSDESVRRRAENVLRSRWPNDPAIVQALIEATNDELESVRLAAAGALVDMGRPELAVATLVELMRNEGGPCSSEARDELERFEPRQRAALPALRAAHLKERGYVHNVIRRAIQRLDPAGPEDPSLFLFDEPE